MSIYFNVTVCWAMKIVSKSRNKIYSAFYFECTKHFHNLWLFWFHLTRSWLYVAFIRVSIVVHRCHRRHRVITARLYTYLIRLINTFGLDSLYRYFVLFVWILLWLLLLLVFCSVGVCTRSHFQASIYAIDADETKAEFIFNVLFQYSLMAF